MILTGNSGGTDSTAFHCWVAGDDSKGERTTLSKERTREKRIQRVVGLGKDGDWDVFEVIIARD